MALNSLPTLKKTHIDVFNNTKRFYHFNHSDQVLSIDLLALTLKQYNTSISELALIEQTLREIERSQGLFALVTDFNLKAKIAQFYQARAKILANLKNLIECIEKGASRLQPVIGKRVGCNEFEKILGQLQKESLMARQALAEEKFNLMQISSIEGMLLDKDQFAAFHQFILQQATSKIRRRYQRLNWFIENPLDEKLIPLEIKNKSFYVLSSAKVTFEQEIGGLSQLFFSKKDKLKLIEEQCYQVASIKSAQQAINTIYHTLTPDSFEQCALPEQPCLKAVMRLETEIKRRRVARQGERVTGMMKFFFGFKNAAINHELNYLNRHFARLQGEKITLMEKALAHLETHYHFKELILPPKEKLDAIKMLLSECEKGVSLIHLDTPRQQEIVSQLKAFRIKFKSCCDISVNLIKKLMQENNYLSAQRMTTRAGLSYLSYHSQETQDLFNTIKKYVSPSQQEAIDVLTSVLLGTSLAPLDLIKQKLHPLFERFKSPRECLNAFIESIFKNTLLPALHSPESYHFQLLANYNPKWTDNWLSKQTTSLEDALIFLRTLYSGQATLDNQVCSIRNKSFTYDRQTFIAQIELLQSFGKQAQSKSFLESFYSIITETIKDQGDQLCFHPDYLAGILVLKDDQLKITYIQALMESCISKQAFDILQNKELIDYLNGSHAFEAVRDPLLAYFKQNQWQSALQSVLDQLEDETPAQEYRYIFLKNRIEHNGCLFDDKELKSLGDDLSKAIGQENELNLYQLLGRQLSSEEAIPPESLALIDRLLAANWSQNINGLRILFEEKRQLLINQNDVAVEIKDLLNMIKLHHFEEALNKIREHILLSTTQNKRSTLHFDIVLGFLNELAHLHQENKLKEDLGSPEQKAKWAFYKALKQAIHAAQWEERETSQTKKDAWLLGFAQIEKNNPPGTHPLGYFFLSVIELNKMNAKPQKALETLLSIYKKIEDNLSAIEKKAFSSLLNLLTGKWIPERIEQVNEIMEILLSDLTSSPEDMSKMSKLILKMFLLPQVDNVKHPAMGLAKTIDPALYDKLMTKEKEIMEGHLSLLDEVLSGSFRFNAAKTMWINGKAMQPSLSLCLDAISSIRYFCQLQQSQLRDSSSTPPVHEFLQTLNTRVGQYLEKCNKRGKLDITFLPLIEALGNERLLDTYLCSLMEGFLKNNQAVAKLKDNQTIFPHLNRPCIQAMIAATLIKNIQSENEIDDFASNNSLQENQLSNEKVFLLLDLIPDENKPPILSLVASHVQWDVKWSNYLGRFAQDETNQRYRCLFLNNFFSDLDFSEQNASLLPSATFQDFDKTYGPENLPLVFKLMEDYLANEANKEKEVGYQFILSSLKEAPIFSPWQKLRESAQAKISILENKSNIKETINEFKAMIQDKEYLAARSKIKQWVRNTKTYSQTAPEFIHNQRLLKSCKIILKEHLLKKLIPQKATFNIAILRDFILVTLPKDEEKKALRALCYENSSHRFHSKNLDSARLYQCLVEFERKAVSHLQKSLPKLGCLEELIEISQRYSLYNLSRLKEKGPRKTYEVAKEKAAFYLKHQKTLDPVLSAIRSARDHFTRTIEQMCRCHANKLNRDQNIPHLERFQTYLDKTMAQWHVKNESPFNFFHFFAKKPSNEVTNLEEDWVVIDLPPMVSSKG